MSVMEDVHCISACRSSYEERGLKYRVLSYARRDNRRSSYEERGLKSATPHGWCLPGSCRSSYEERGLKFEVRSCNVGMIGSRSSYEERGLKLFIDGPSFMYPKSLLV